MAFEVIESKAANLQERAIRLFEEWWLERRIRVANNQVKLAEESTAISLTAAAQWRGYSLRLQDERTKRGYKARGNDWKPPLDWLTLGMLAVTCAGFSLAIVLALGT